MDNTENSQPPANPPFAALAGSAAGVESGMCEQCHGQGWYMDGPTEDPQQRQCEACYGTGSVEQAKPQPNDQAHLSAPAGKVERKKDDQ